MKRFKSVRGECFREAKMYRTIYRLKSIPRYNRSLHSRSLGTNGVKIITHVSIHGQS